MTDTNYTKPDMPDHIDNPKDWLMGALVFAQALSNTLEEGEGILIKAKGDAAGYFGKEDELLVVANLESQAQIFPLSDYLEDQSDFQEGMFITLSTEK